MKIMLFSDLLNLFIDILIVTFNCIPHYQDNRCSKDTETKQDSGCGWQIRKIVAGCKFQGQVPFKCLYLFLRYFREVGLMFDQSGVWGLFC